jgi:hypothetical protein
LCFNYKRVWNEEQGEPTSESLNEKRVWFTNNSIALDN